MNSGISYVHKETLEIVSRYELTHEDVEAIVELHNENENNDEITYDEFIKDPSDFDQSIKEYMMMEDFEFYEEERDEIDYDWWIESE